MMKVYFIQMTPIPTTCPNFTALPVSESLSNGHNQGQRKVSECAPAMASAMLHYTLMILYTLQKLVRPRPRPEWPPEQNAAYGRLARINIWDKQ
jgi:hypothetical protein